MSIFLTQTASDNFQYANIAPLPSPPWTNAASVGGLAVVSEICQASGGATQAEMYSGTTLAGNQYASATIYNMAASGVFLDLYIRSQYSTSIWYNYSLYLLKGSVSTAAIVYSVNGIGQLTSIIYLPGVTISNGDVWTIVAIGSTIYLVQNGTVLASVSDSMWASGPYAGMGMQDHSSTTDVQVSLFSIGTAATTGSISGSCGEAGATINYSGTASGSVTADGSGNYSITGLSAGSYTITPSKSSYVFSPTSRNVTLPPSQTGINFTASVAYIVQPWMYLLPFTQLIDLANDSNYPMPYRVGAAALVKLMVTQKINLSNPLLPNNSFTGWQNAMIARQQAQTPGFAAIYASAPVLPNPYPTPVIPFIP